MNTLCCNSFFFIPFKMSLCLYGNVYLSSSFITHASSLSISYCIYVRRERERESGKHLAVPVCLCIILCELSACMAIRASLFVLIISEDVGGSEFPASNSLFSHLVLTVCLTLSCCWHLLLIRHNTVMLSWETCWLKVPCVEMLLALTVEMLPAVTSMIG